MEVDFTGTLGK